MLKPGSKRQYLSRHPSVWSSFFWAMNIVVKKFFVVCNCHFNSALHDQCLKRCMPENRLQVTSHGTIEKSLALLLILDSNLKSIVAVP